MELTKEEKQTIINIVKIVYSNIDRSDTSPLKGLEEAQKSLDLLHTFFPQKQYFDYSCDIFSDMLKGDFDEDYID